MMDVYVAQHNKFQLPLRNSPRLQFTVPYRQCLQVQAHLLGTRGFPPGLLVVDPWCSPTSGFEILGVPVGSDVFIKDKVNRKAMSLTALLERLGQLGCHFSAMQILRSCLVACKITYLLRALPFFAGASLASDVQMLLYVCLSVIVGCPLSSTQWKLASLPLRLGGLDIFDPVFIHDSAFVSDFLGAWDRCNLNGLQTQQVPLEFTSVVQKVHQLAGPLLSLMPRVPSEGLSVALGSH